MASEGRWKTARHLLTIDQAIAETINGESEQVLVIEAPPRHGKSELCSKYLPACFLGNNPDKRVILASYEANFARSWGRKSRNVLEQHGQRFYGVRVSQEQSASIDWEIEGHEGGMITAGVGGPITGRGANCLIVDDPVKNAEEAMSETLRNSTWDWWQSTAFTRLEPGGVAIVIATRWHKDDLSGRLIAESESGEGPKVRRLTFPAIADDGSALWPERWPIERLEKIRHSLDLFWWLCLYQQTPSKAGRSEWPDEYFGEHIWAETWPDTFEASAMAIDPSKGKNAKSGDFSAIVSVSLCGGLLYVDASLERRPAEKLVEDGIEFWRRSPCESVGIEANAFQDLLQTIFDEHCRTHRVPPLPISLINNSVNKELRIGRIGPYLANRKIRFRKASVGCKLLVDQLREFPLAAHDDGPDGLEMAIRLLNHLAVTPQESPDEYVTA
jgi:predicted phage terminase large subunit-like protein